MNRCETCHRDYQPKDERANRPSRYCSRACSHEAQRTRVALTCRQCGRSFQRKAYMQDWSQERGPFCGLLCYGVWQQENARGEANPNYRPRSSVRGAGQWERARQVVLDRDGHCCQQCGSTHRLHVHHREPWQSGQADPHALDNLETLCASCHRRRHPMPLGPDGRFQSIR
jgi:5-methylcytosine-specific restriction endonuclease McrA